jgi:NAD-dependent dihydropyrimidine dehydrogenase PreA subunit
MTSSRTILVGGNLVGLVGLDEVFEQFFKSDIKPTQKLGEKLLVEIKRLNYIPAKAEKDYREALSGEYRIYYIKGKTQKGEKIAEPQKTYKGIPREQIPWFPTVHQEKCDGCKECLKLCPTGVYMWDDQTQKPLVINPLNCVVGCSNCAIICKRDAIIFPPKTILDTLGNR